MDPKQAPAMKMDVIRGAAVTWQAFFQQTPSCTLYGNGLGCDTSHRRKKLSPTGRARERIDDDDANRARERSVCRFVVISGGDENNSRISGMDFSNPTIARLLLGFAPDASSSFVYTCALLLRVVLSY